MRRRLTEIAERMNLRDPESVGAQLALAFDGAFMSAPLGTAERTAESLRQIVQALITAARTD
jgi:hypothetical protein